MTADERQRLRDAAQVALKGVNARSSVKMDSDSDSDSDWQLQTSNSFRRVGTVCGDGNVLCGTKHPLDGHPDLLAARGVLEFIIAAQPRVVLELLDELARHEDEIESRRGEYAELVEKNS